MEIVLAALVAAGVSLAVVFIVQRPRAAQAGVAAMAAPVETVAAPHSEPGPAPSADAVDEELNARPGPSSPASRSGFARATARLELTGTQPSSTPRALARRPSAQPGAGGGAPRAGEAAIRSANWSACGLSPSQAKQILLRNLGRARHDSERLDRARSRTRPRRDADRRARSILST